MKSKPNISLIIGIAIPIVMVLFVACSIYLPGLFIQPKVDFLYMTGSNDRYSCKMIYEVHGGTLQHIVPPSPYNDPAYVKQECSPMFYVYDVKTNESREVTFEEAQKLKADPSAVSPDGFELVRGNGGGGDFLFLFDMGRDYNSVYLKGHNVSRKVNIKRTGGDEYSYLDYQFLGWILP
ncbi:MAG TPA: hypothetical protein PKV72_03820 [Candidatus Peribacteria bacterium]|nr:hypothetical protein [Candidatus Peribacteria bacterium]